MDRPSERETVGFIDVGTNSIHLLVVVFYPDAAPAVIYRDKESVRLGRSLYGTGRIDAEGLARTALVIDRFAHIARERGAGRVTAFATCAAREAVNAHELMDLVSDAVELRVIPGIEEARLISLGVFGADGPSERTICLDIGGGSTEVIIRQDGEDLFLDSLSMGAIRYRYGKDIDFTGRVRQSDYAHLLRSVDLSSYHAVNRIRVLGYDRAVGSSGTMETIAAMCSYRRGDGDPTWFTFEELHRLMMELCSMTAEQRLSVPGMGKNRADIIIPGGAIAEELMSQFGISRMEVSPHGLKEGMMLDYRLSHGHTVFDSRLEAVMALGRRCSFDERHAVTVERNAMRLFDIMGSLGMHDMGPGWRNLLSSSALLHDVGESISYQNHNILSQAIIENVEIPGFTYDDTRLMGMIARFHHKKFPGPRDDRLSGLDRSVALSVRMCAMMLRMADVMDRHRNDMVVGLEASIDEDMFVLEMTTSEDPSMELWSLEKLRNDFCKLFDLELAVRPHDHA